MAQIAENPQPPLFVLDHKRDPIDPIMGCWDRMDVDIVKCDRLARCEMANVAESARTCGGLRRDQRFSSHIQRCSKRAMEDPHRAAVIVVLVRDQDRFNA